jgi:tetratricopeptide (TPR) repeat protein
MVIKSKDLEILENAYKDSFNNKGEIVLLSAEYGTDLDDLLDTFQKNKQNDNTIFLKTECFGYKNVEPYYCFINLLDSLKNKVLYLNVDFKIDELEPQNYDPIFDNIISDRFIEIFGTILYSYNIVLYIKNIQLGDQKSLNLFTYLADFAKTKNILIIASYFASENINPYFKDVLSLLEIKSNVIKLKIENFTIEEFFIFLKENRYNLPEYIAEKIYNITRGNTLRTLGLLNKLEANKFIDEDRNWAGYSLDFTEDFFKEPDAIIISTYYNLKESHMQILNNAAIIGKEFSQPLLQKISNVEKDYLYNILNDMSNSNIISYRDEKYFFPSLSFQFYVYSQISNIRKKIVHKKIAEILELENADSETVAFHFFNANMTDKAHKYYLEAGFKKISSYDFKAAYECIKKAEKINENLDAKTKLALGEVCKNLDKYDESIKYYNSVLESLNEHDKISVYAGLGTVYAKTGDTNKALEYFQKVLSSSMDRKMRIISHRGLASISFLKKDFKSANEHIAITLMLLKDFNDHYEIAETYKDLAKIYFEENENLEKVESFSTKALEEFFQINYYEGVARVYNNMGNMSLEKKSMSEALKYYESALKYADLAGNFPLIFIINYNISEVHIYMGDISSSQASINIAQKLMNVDSMGELSLLFYYTLGDLSLWQGNFNDSKKHFLKCRDLALKMNIDYRWVLAESRLFYIDMILGKNINLDALAEHWYHIATFDLRSARYSELKSKLAYYMIYGVNEDVSGLFEKYIKTFEQREYWLSVLDVYILNAHLLIYENKIENFVELYNKIHQHSEEKEYNSIDLQIINIAYYYITKDYRFSESLRELENYLKKNALVFMLSRLYLYLGIIQFNMTNSDEHLKKAELLLTSIGAFGSASIIKKIKK